MADFYCDYLTGNDTTGNGSTGTPYKTLNKAISVSNGGDNIYLSNSAAFPVTSPISWTGFAATTAVGNDTPLVIRAWDNGGSITILHPSGNLVAAELDGVATASTLFSSSSKPRFVYFERIKFHNTTDAVVGAADSWSFHQCEFYGAGSNTLLISDAWNRIISCIFRDSGGSSIDGINTFSTGSYVYGCYFHNITGVAIDCIGSGFIINNVIKSGAEGGLNISGARVVVTGNTIIGDGTTNQVGVNVVSGAGRITLFNNIITHHNGSGAKGINIPNSCPWMIGYNSFYGNTANMNGTITVKGIDMRSADVTETSSPYTNSAGADFSLTSIALSRNAGFPRAFTGTSTLTYPALGSVAPQTGAAAVSRGYAYCC